MDTNVPKAASGVAQQASPACVAACRGAVLRVMRDEVRLRVDSGGQIIREYQRNLSESGEPRLGAEFLEWVLTNRSNKQRCPTVTLNPRPEDPSDFAEFPQCAGLKGFDPSDRKFVAVANARGPKPPIQQALDSKWWGYREALASVGIVVEFLCLTEVQTVHERRFGAPRAARRPRRG